MKEPLTCRALSPANPTMLRPYGAARVVMSWRGNYRRNDLEKMNQKFTIQDHDETLSHDTTLA
jgi:hypothetical protein